MEESRAGHAWVTCEAIQKEADRQYFTGPEISQVRSVLLLTKLGKVTKVQLILNLLISIFLTFQARQQLRIVYPPIPDLSEKKIVTQLNSTVTINFTIEAFPRPDPRGVTWVRLREDSEEGVEVEEGVEDDWIELNLDVGPDKVRI